MESRGYFCPPNRFGEVVEVRNPQEDEDSKEDDNEEDEFDVLEVQLTFEEVLVVAACEEVEVLEGGEEVAEEVLDLEEVVGVEEGGEGAGGLVG